jgi:hypothetical protein
VAIIKYIVIIILVVINLSCSGVYKLDWDYLPKRVADDIVSEYGKEVTYKQVRFYIQGKITYTRDTVLYQKTEYIATASEIWCNKRGDCEDIAILELALCNQLFNKKGKLLRGYSKDGIGHAIAIVDGYKFDEIYDVFSTTNYNSIASLYITMNY